MGPGPEERRGELAGAGALRRGCGAVPEFPRKGDKGLGKDGEDGDGSVMGDKVHGSEI